MLDLFLLSDLHDSEFLWLLPYKSMKASASNLRRQVYKKQPQRTAIELFLLQNLTPDLMVMIFYVGNECSVNKKRKNISEH